MKRSAEILADVISHQVKSLKTKKHNLGESGAYDTANLVQISINHYNGLNTESDIQNRINALEKDIVRLTAHGEVSLANQMQISVNLYKGIFTAYDQLVGALA